MEMQEVMEGSNGIDASAKLCNGGLEPHNIGEEEMESFGVDLLNEMDSYWDDIGDRLTVSRMVSDSVIKGMVCAIEQEATEKIARKDSELAMLKETLHLYHVGADTDSNELVAYSNVHHVPRSREEGLHSIGSNSFLEHEELHNFLNDLKDYAMAQFKKLKKEINNIKSFELDKIKASEIGKFNISRNGSGSHLFGLSGILQENMPEKWIDVDRMLDGLQTTLASTYVQTEEMVCLSKSLISEWQQEREFQAEIEELVVKNCIRGFQEEFEQGLGEQKALSNGNESANWLEKQKSITDLRRELDAISKSLSVHENGQLISHGSLEHRKASCNHVSSNSVWEGNGKHDGSIIVPENLDHAQLKHLSKDELFTFFKTEMTKMKRHYESKEHEMTEELFSLKREYLKERGSSLPVRKDKELESLKKKIPEVIRKLDGILIDNEKHVFFVNHGHSLDSLKDRLESMRLENVQLRNLLADKKKEIKSLSSQVSSASDKALEHSLNEKNLSIMLENLKNAMEDAQLETSISDDVYKVLLKEVVADMEGFSEELELESKLLREIYENVLKEAAENSQPISNSRFDDLLLETTITQGISEVIVRESLKEAQQKYIGENEARLSLEMAILENERALKLSIAENEKLEKEMFSLRAEIDEKNNLLQEATAALAKEKEKYELASHEQQQIISRYDGELQIINGDLNKALEKIEMDKSEISKLREHLEIANQKLREAVAEKNELLSVFEDHQNTLALIEAREREHKKQTSSTFVLVKGLSEALAGFECKATKDMKMNSLRLENLSFQVSSLIQKANGLRQTELLYKEKLERKSSDLQKAEAEVDLLGDEVDTLLSLLEKIYIALDHYSPILQHYPGIMEILKLVRRELSGESVKPL